MRTSKLLIIILLFALFHNYSFAGGPDYWQGKGRVALSSDGNKHDNDDMLASMMTLMILAKGELHDEVVLYTYADHIWASENDDLAKMKISVLGAADSFCFNNTEFIAAVEDPEAAYNAMSREIKKSTADDPLFIIAAGPMQVVGEGLDRANNDEPASLGHVTVISHSTWNERHSDNPADGENHSGWTWSEMKTSFGSKVNFVEIDDQNGAEPNPYGDENDFSASWSYWDWMRTHQDPAVNWVYTRGKSILGRGDYSDAGMAYYLLTNDEFGNHTTLKDWIGTGMVPKGGPKDSTKVWSVQVDPTSHHIENIGETVQLNATIVPSKALDKTVAWESSSNAIASVSSTGLVTGHSVGFATITVTTNDGGYSAKVEIQVGEIDPSEVKVGDDYIVFEAEATNSDLGLWEIRQPGWSQYVEGNSGVLPINNTYLEYTGGTENGNAAGQDILVYKFTPKTDGTYRLTGRMAQNLQGAAWDKCNDIYVKMSGDFEAGPGSATLSELQTWQKLYGRGHDGGSPLKADWGAFVKGDIHEVKYSMKYTLKAGVEYTFSVSGRAQRTCIDYFLFVKEQSSVEIAERKDLATHTPVYMRPGPTGPVCMTIKAHDFDITSVSGYDVATKGTIPNSPADGINKGEEVIGCSGSKGLTRPIAAEETYEGTDADVTFVVKAVGEPDGECTYEVFLNGTKVGEKQATRIYGTDTAPYTYEDLVVNDTPVSITSGDVIRVTSNQVSNELVEEGDGFATARGRWASLDICGEGIVIPVEETVSFVDLPSAYSNEQSEIPVKVGYTTNKTRDIYIELKTPDDVLIENKTVSVVAGTGQTTITVVLDAPLAVVDGYKINVALRTQGGGAETNVAEQVETFNVVDGPVIPTADEISFVNPQSSYSNEILVFPVVVSYAATERRDLNIELKDPTNTYVTNKRKTVEAGYGETTIEVTVGSNLAVATGYKFIASIRPVGGNWQTNVDKKDHFFDITDSGVAVPVDEVSYRNLPDEFGNSLLELPIDVSYNVELQRDINVELKTAADEFVASNNITVEPGSGDTTVVVVLSEQLTVADNYKLILSIRPVGGDWSTNIARVDEQINIIDDGLAVVAPTIDLLNDNETILVGGELELNATTTPDDATILWTSSNENVATVTDFGVVTGQSEGVATITSTVAGGVSDSCKVTVSSTLNLDLANNKQFDIFPNPTYGMINFVNDGTISSLQIFDMQGRVLFEGNARQGLNAIDISEFNAGVYFVNIFHKNDPHQVIRIIRQ